MPPPVVGGTIYYAAMKKYNVPRIKLKRYSSTYYCTQLHAVSTELLYMFWHCAVSS
jgi:hypothetical protein